MQTPGQETILAEMTKALFLIDEVPAKKLSDGVEVCSTLSFKSFGVSPDECKGVNGAAGMGESRSWRGDIDNSPISENPFARKPGEPRIFLQMLLGVLYIALVLISSGLGVFITILLMIPDILKSLVETVIR